MAKNSTPTASPAELWKAVQRTVLEAAAKLSPEIRQRAARGQAEGPAAGYVARVHERAFSTTEAHIDELRKAGLDDDAIFELTVSAAVGAAELRRERGLAAIAAAVAANKRVA